MTRFLKNTFFSQSKRVACVLRIKEDDRRFQRYVPTSGANGKQGYETATLAAHHGSHEVHLRAG